MAGPQLNWLLTKQSDIFGNAIDYHYTQDANPLLSQIAYPGYTITFIYEKRLFPLTQYQRGVESRLDKRLKSIEVKSNSLLVYAYQFSYETTNTLITFERLSQITQCFSDGQCLNPVTFG